MSTYAMTFLVCDLCGEEFDHFARLAVEVREVAAEKGWRVNRHGGKQDLCPACRATRSGRQIAERS